MSLISGIENIMKKNKEYLYHQIINLIDNVSSDFSKETQIQIKEEKTTLQEIIISTLSNYAKDNKINIEKSNEIKDYFVPIKNFLVESKQDLRKFHFEILYNLLTSAKGNSLLKRMPNENVEKATNFIIFDFILNYTKATIGILFNKIFDEKDFNKLNDVYLYFIFQIKDSNIIQILKILIYKYLYDKNNINDFIMESSKEIVSKRDNKNIAPELRNFESEYNEINMNFKKVQDNICSFFGKNLKRNKLDLLSFFNPKQIKSNDIYINDGKLESEEEIIVIDDLNYKKDKIHLFSTEFLIVNGLQSNITDSDFQIFNSDNYSVDLFSKFLLKIIEEINNSIKINNFQNDFIDKHYIAFRTNKLTHFISTKIDYEDKKQLKESKIENIKNPFNKIKIYQNNNSTDINSEEENNIESEENTNKKKKKDKGSLFSETNYSNEVKYKADDFEYYINDILTNKINKKELILLPNLLFMLNLKIPRYNTKKNSIDFLSAHLDYSNEETKHENDNYSYGYKEIDSVFKNNSKYFIEVENPKSFEKQLKYVKEKNHDNFTFVKNDKYNFSIRPNSIFFCEIKYQFPGLTPGSNSFVPIKIQNNSENKQNLSPYQVQLKKLIKKFNFFHPLYKEIINQAFIQIVLLYDFVNVNQVITDEKILKKETEYILSKYGKLLDMEKIYFQLVYFDYNKTNLELRETVKAQEKEMKEVKKENAEVKKENAEVKEEIAEVKEKIAGVKDKLKNFFENQNINIEGLPDEIKQFINK